MSLELRSSAIAAIVLLGTSHPASALLQARHRAISSDACGRAGLPRAFCDRVGAEAYDVDANEFNDLAAHAQIPDGMAACDAANASMLRLLELGADLRVGLYALGNGSGGADAIASALGRALHTVQDNCAHHGMPNPQHAWHSLADSCRSTTESPDVQPEAFRCAAVETDAVLAAFGSAMGEAGVAPRALAQVSPVLARWPRYGDVCNFLGSAKTWDGNDRRWENAVVGPALRQQLVEAITLDGAELVDVCASGAAAIAVNYSDPRTATAGGARSCLKVHLFCLGKADDASEAPPYDQSEPAVAAALPSAGGCSVAPGSPSTGLTWGLALALGVVALRRRRRLA